MGKREEHIGNKPGLLLYRDQLGADVLGQGLEFRNRKAADRLGWHAGLWKESAAWNTLHQKTHALENLF